MTTTRFEGKTVLVTGATSGMGLAGALRLAREGATLVLHGASTDRATALQNEIPDARVLHGDLSRRASIDALRDAVVGGLDGLWLNAGVAELGAIAATSPEMFDRMMAVNVRAPFLLLAAVAPLLRDGASVVATASTSAYEGAAETAVYAATKGAIIAAVRSWAVELAPRRVRVNTLVPGAIETDFRRFLDGEQRAEFEGAVAAATPLQRAGTADEAAAVALFLLSDDSSYVTASQYSVDGGLTRT